jgi:hypothetical protein
MMVLSRSLPRSKPGSLGPWGSSDWQLCAASGLRHRVTSSRGDESVPSASNGDPRPKTAGIVVQAACRFLAICGPPLVHAGAHSQVQTPAHIHLQQIWDPFRRIGGDFTQHVYWIDAAVGAVATGAPETPGVSRNATQVRDLTDRRSLRHQHRWPWRVCDPRWCAP